jgi:hypothetical protein
MVGTEKLEPCGCGSPGIPHVHPRFADNSIWEPIDIETGRTKRTGPGVAASLSDSPSPVVPIIAKG